MMWWNKKYGKGKICPITHTRLRPGYTVFLNCKHGFCKSALRNMYITTGKLECPMCRRPFERNRIFY